MALICALLLSTSIPTGAAGAAETDWPTIESPQTKAWTRWWWHGNAVEAADLTAEMEKYAAAGIGGLEITPIYGVRGGEADFIPYLSPEWIDRFEHVLREADRLGMQIDMSTGTGWPFGGNWVDADTACRTLVLQTFELKGGETLKEPVESIQKGGVSAIGRRVRIEELKEPLRDNPDLQALALEKVKFEKPLPLAALVAVNKEGKTKNLTDRVGEGGKLDWTAPDGQWTLYAVFLGWHGKMVERAGPGGEGNVIDHFSRPALDAYLKKFDNALAGHDINSFRAFFNDSYEVDDGGGNANVTPDMFAQFERLRGYDLRDHLPALFGKASADENSRVLCDYRETISDLLLEEFTKPWTAWSHKYEAITRNQSHGSPANILDLYAASDIPETEGTDRIQFISASSAAHVAGKPLISAEACTWLNEHFLGTLAEAKTWCDRYFLGGVNHICYHGTCFSPPNDPWPGRLFYASVELQPTSPFWPHFHALNEYVARCQSFLQGGKSDNDILVYYPICDEWSAGQGPNMPHFNGEMRGTTTRRTVEKLLNAGYGVDLISDRQIADVKVENGMLALGGVTYKALVLPASQTIPLATLERIEALAEVGAKVQADGELPKSVSGMAGAGEQKESFTAAVEKLKGKLAANLEDVPGEAFVTNTSLEFVRRRFEDGFAYFIVNTSREPFVGVVRLRAEAQAAVLFDPLSGATGVAGAKPTDAGTEVHLQLAPGGTCIVRTYDHPIEGAPFSYGSAAGDATALEGPWKLTFVSGGPELPAAAAETKLGSWTDGEGEAVKNFSGIGRYSIEFAKLEGDAEAYVLDLGEVHETAEVKLNGESLATLFTAPYRVRIPVGKLQATNTLEVEVANLMANRIADMDRRGVVWKKFYNVNMPSRRPENRGPGGLFSAAKWNPLPSGLLGPVTLTPMADDN
jgi:hypothetical protein